MPTILDVAAKAGVGVGTVSRVLNESSQVSDTTRAKVKAAIAELGYRPSAIARALSSGRSSALPVFAPQVTLPSTTARLGGILDVVDDVHEIVVCQVSDPTKRFDFVDRHTTRMPAFGVLAISLDLEPTEVQAFRDAEVPLVSIDYAIDDVPSIVIDDHAAGTQATHHLMELGHASIAFIGDRPSGDYRSRASEERRQGYRDALSRGRLEPGPEIEVDGSKRDAARALLAGPELPTAIVADADSTALCVLAVARSMGLSVPGDLSIVGFDDLWAADAAGLTTIAQPLADSGRRGAQMLFAAARGVDVPLRTSLRTELVVRDSTAPPSTTR